MSDRTSAGRATGHPTVTRPHGPRSWTALVLLALAAGCRATGSNPPPTTPPGPPGPPPPPATVHALAVSRHTTAAIDAARVDAILADMQDILRTDDGPGDVACDVGFARAGVVGTFATGNGIVNSQADFAALIALPGEVKVVRQINWCGQLQPNVIGCAPVPGNSMVVVRFAEPQEGVLWVHEFGHNRGLSHRSGTGAVMAPVIDPLNRRVDATECNAYR